MPLVNSQEYRFLVGGFKPENISQIGSFCRVGVQIKKKWNHHPGFILCFDDFDEDMKY